MSCLTRGVGLTVPSLERPHYPTSSTWPSGCTQGGSGAHACPPTPSPHPLASPAVRPVPWPEARSAGWAPRRASPAHVSSPSSRPAAPTPARQPHWGSGGHPRLALPCGPVPLPVRGSSALEALGSSLSLSPQSCGRPLPPWPAAASLSWMFILCPDSCRVC